MRMRSQCRDTSFVLSFEFGSEMVLGYIPLAWISLFTCCRMIYDADCRMAVQAYGHRLLGSIAWLTNVILAAHELDSYVHIILWWWLGTSCHDDSITNTDVPNLLRNDFYDKWCADLRDVPWEVRLRTRKKGWFSESRNPLLHFSATSYQIRELI